MNNQPEHRRAGPKRSPKTINTMIYGKVPPQAKQMEEAILGAIMIEAQAIDMVTDLLTPEVFYVNAHQQIFKAMISLVSKSQPIDILTVTEELRRTEVLEEVGGPYYVQKLTNSVVSSANIESHAKIVFEKFIQREVIEVGGYLIEEGFSDATDAFDLLDKVEERLYNVTKALHKKGHTEISTLLVRTIKKLEKIRHEQGTITGVPSGYRAIDKITHGWQNSDLIVLAARPGVGKTALALNLARNAAMDPFKPTPVAFFSLEMSEDQLTERLISAESEVSLDKIKKGRLNDDDMKIIYTRGLQKISQAPIFIDDQGSMNLFELRAKARRLKQKNNVGLIIIDYLQLMTGTGEKFGRSREQEVSAITSGLKGLAKELQVPIIALSQLSRAVENRSGEKMPQLSDLRESGGIEQDADIVAFIYRPEYYGIQKDPMGESNPGLTKIKFAKNRNGSLDTIDMKANLWIQKFTEIEEDTKKLPSQDYKSLQSDPGEKLTIQTGMKMNEDETVDDLPF